MPENAINPEDFRRLEGEVTDMKQLMGQMTQALTRLALLEERHQNSAEIMNRIMSQLETLRAEQHKREIEAAGSGNLKSQVEALEKAFREMYVESERRDAAMTASLKTIRLITVAGWTIFIGLGGGALIFKLFGG